MADEEPVDQKTHLEESCKPNCMTCLEKTCSCMLRVVGNAPFVRSIGSACVKRIQGDETGHKHCTGQYFDYWSCIDKCVASKLFSKLK